MTLFKRETEGDRTNAAFRRTDGNNPNVEARGCPIRVGPRNRTLRSSATDAVMRKPLDPLTDLGRREGQAFAPLTERVPCAAPVSV
jgi:hypothetical protein